jgi:putative ABC transport system permease protein
VIVGETVRVALDAVRANKLRSFLTMLGIIIGIAAVITMVSLGQGARQSVEEQVRRLGTSTLTVRPGQQFMGGIDRGAAPLTAEDAEALARGGSAIRAVAPEMESRLQVVAGASNANLEVVATWPAYFAIQGHTVAAGRLFSEGEERGRRRVAVLGAKIGQELGLTETVTLLGQTVTLGGVPFTVIGVLREKGQQGWMDPDDTVFIPLATGQLRVLGSDRLRTIYVQAASEAAMDPALVEIDRILRRSHRLRPGEDSDFTVRNAAALLSTFQETTRTFTFLLAGISLVSLLVGGIGIMNIMLVSVTERTREIGIRKALGARQRDILLQFLVEALAICLAGGTIGVAAGAAVGAGLQRFAGWNATVAPQAVILAFGFSASVGLFFGIWPARRAARLDPIVALRYE